MLQAESKFIEKVEGLVNHNTSHDLPHHAVKNDTVTAPIRVVFKRSSGASKEEAVYMTVCIRNVT